MNPLPASLLTALAFVVLVAAIPTFEHFSGWDNSMGSFVPGASVIEAIGRHDTSGSINVRHLNVPEPGTPGNITTKPTSEARRHNPTLFYIHHNQLWQLINSTTIYAVNAYNVSSSSSYPLQLISTSGTRKQHFRTSSNGSWRWLGSMLIYEEGKLTNGGLYYECPIKDSDGLKGVFTFLERSGPPEGCSPMTLHGFNKLFTDQSKPPAR